MPAARPSLAEIDRAAEAVLRFQRLGIGVERVDIVGKKISVFPKDTPETDNFDNVDMKR